MKHLIHQVPSWLKTAIKVTIAILLVFWVVQRGALDFSILADLFSVQLLLPCVVLLGINLWLTSERWRRLVNAQCVEMGSWDALRLTLIGTFFNFAMPGAVGGDLVKGYYLAQRTPGRKMDTGLSVFVDRLVGFYAMIIMALVVMLSQWSWIAGDQQLQILLGGIATFFVVFTVFFLVVFTKTNPLVLWGLRTIEKFPGGPAVIKIYRSVHIYGEQKGALGFALLLSFFAQLTAVFLFWWVGQGMGLTQIPLVTYVIAIPLGFIVSALPIAPAGIGVGQAAFLFFFNVLVGEPTQLGPTAITLFQILLFMYGVVGAVLYLRQKESFRELTPI